MLAIYGICTSDLLKTIAYNLEHDFADTHLQMQVAYNDLSVDRAQAFKSLSQREAGKLMKQFNEWLAKHNGNYRSEAERAERRRAGFGVYYFEEEYDDKKEETPVSRDG